MDLFGHPVRTGPRQGGVGRVDGGQCGEVPTPHTCVKDLEVRQNHWRSARPRRFGVRLGICRASTGRKPTNEDHYEETEESEQFRFACVRIHRILGPFYDWPPASSSTLSQSLIGFPVRLPIAL